MSSATSYNSTSGGHMCDMDRCVLRTSLSLRNFGRRFYRCQHWSSDSDQACKFFKWLDKNTCPCGHATTPLVWERFMRLADEAAAAKNERDMAHAMEAEAQERERIAKRKVEKSKLILQIAEDKIYKYKLALIMSWIVVGVYFVFSTIFGGHGQAQSCLS